MGVSEELLPVGTLDNNVGLSEGCVVGFAVGFALLGCAVVGAGDAGSGLQEPLSNGFIATCNNCWHPFLST